MTTKYWPDPNGYDTITTACATAVLPNAATVHTGQKSCHTGAPDSNCLLHYSLSLWVRVFMTGKSHVWSWKVRPHDFTTKAWCAPDGDPRVQCLSLFQSHLCQQHRHTQTLQTASCCQEISATNYCTPLFPSLPRHYIKQTPSLRPPRSGSTPCTDLCSWDCSEISAGATWAAEMQYCPELRQDTSIPWCHCRYIGSVMKPWPTRHCLALYCWTLSINVWNHLTGDTLQPFHFSLLGQLCSLNKKLLTEN